MFYKIFLGEATSEFHDNVKRYYWQIYLESIDTVVNCIKSRFEQKDYVNCYAKVESTLLLKQKVKHLMSISWQFVLFMEMT